MAKRTTDGNRRLSPWLAEVCRGAREMKKVSQADIAHLAGVHRSAISRFELEAPWPDNPDQIVKAYAEAAGLDDSRILWEKAVAAWKEVGEDYELPHSASVSPETFSEVLDDYLQKKREDARVDERGPDELPASGHGE